ncbi:MAG: class I SAM-dependent methyltransferase [Patescibacteria group bacterium]|jgi:ubiquinone/menaquinone biosynthesis C-methylase UbiE|nr:class I SAM-dependent methyltransferase [Patescibacteria group bacterium]
MNNIFGGNKLLYFEEIIKKANLKEGMKVADLGCGTHGYFIFKPSFIVGTTGSVYAVDVLKPVLDNINKTIKLENHKNITTIWSNLENYKATKIDSMILDFVFLVNVLHQSNKKVDILREAIRMLKKNAKIVIVDWVEGASVIGPEKDKKINKENLIIALQKLGLNLEEDFVAGKFHYGLIFKKI